MLLPASQRCHGTAKVVRATSERTVQSHSVEVYFAPKLQIIVYARRCQAFEVLFCAIHSVTHIGGWGSSLFVLRLTGVGRFESKTSLLL